MTGSRGTEKDETCEERGPLSNYEIATALPGTEVAAADKPVRFVCSARCRLSILIIIVFIINYMHRVNFSLAVVCMVNLDPGDGYPPTDNASISSGGVYKHNRTAVSIQQADAGKTSCQRFGSDVNNTITPELDWDKSHVSVLLSSYFYGSFFTQIPGGRMADKFGGKHVLTLCLVVSGIASLLIPVCARAHIGLVFVLRIFIGLAGGAIIPAGLSMINVWAPAQERAPTVSLCSSGHFIGTIVAYLTSGLLCAYGFDNGWPSIFYVYGAFTLLFVLLWNYEVYNTPNQHPRISPAELDYITTYTNRSKATETQTLPWTMVLISKPVWASIITHFGYNWSVFTVLINTPLFLKEVLKFDIQQNGFYSSLPYLFCMITTMCSGTLAQVLIKRGIFSTLGARKALTTVSLLGTGASVVGAGFVTCETRYIAVVLLCAACMFTGFSFGGFLTNHGEYGGQFAGTLYGLSNAAGVVSALVASMAAGLLTPNGLQREWQTVFYVAASMDVIGVTAFLLMSSADLQPWARGEPVGISTEQELNRLTTVLDADADGDVTRTLNIPPAVVSKQTQQ